MEPQTYVPLRIKIILGNQIMMHHQLLHVNFEKLKCENMNSLDWQNMVVSMLKCNHITSEAFKETTYRDSQGTWLLQEA